jgi:hypothetical protein
MHFGQRIVTRLTVPLVAIGLAVFVSSASALCIVPEEEGEWVNIDPNTQSITAAEIHMTQCGDLCKWRVPTDPL